MMLFVFLVCANVLQPNVLLGAELLGESRVVDAAFAKMLLDGTSVASLMAYGFLLASRGYDYCLDGGSAIAFVLAEGCAPVQARPDWMPRWP